MSMSLVRKDRIRGPDQVAVQTALRAQNPQVGAEEIEELAKMLLLMFEVVTELPKAERAEIARDHSQLRAAFGEALGRISIEEPNDVTTMRGSGLGKVLDIEDGRKRLARYATPTKLEDWAGEVAGASRIEDLFGIKRSTLGSWYQQGAIVGLLRGQRKLAYPVDQFVDARPLEGLDQVLTLAPDVRSAWLWARQPHGALDGRTPLELLRAGGKVQVIAVAKQDFA